MFKCRKCGTFNLMRFRLLGKSSFIDTIQPNDSRYKSIIKKHDLLFAASEKKDDHATGEEISQTLRRLGASISLQDLIDANSPGGSEIEFAALDRATAIAFDRLVKVQTKLLATCLPAALRGDSKALLMAVGGHVFVGFITGRRLFNTHKRVVNHCGDEAKTDEKAALLESLSQQMKAADLLHDAGEQFEDFLEKWATYHAGQGIYDDIPTADAAPNLIYVHLLNGWSLSIAEYQMTL